LVGVLVILGVCVSVVVGVGVFVGAKVLVTEDVGVGVGVCKTHWLFTHIPTFV